MINNVTLAGRLTDNVIIYDAGKDSIVANFTLAVNGYNGNNDINTNFIQCVAWNKLAEVLEKFTAKGDKITIQGRLETGSYEKNGQTHYTAKVVIQNIELPQLKEKETSKDVRRNTRRRG